MNNVNLTGRLTKAPDRPTVTASGPQVLDLRLAVNHHRRDTVYVDVTCWEGVAEAAADHLTKGSLVGVTGELGGDEWTDKATGEARHRYYVNARSLDFPGFRLGVRPLATTPRHRGHGSPAGAVRNSKRRSWPPTRPRRSQHPSRRAQPTDFGSVSFDPAPGPVVRGSSC